MMKVLGDKPMSLHVAICLSNPNQQLLDAGFSYHGMIQGLQAATYAMYKLMSSRKSTEFKVPVHK